jgi:hypothetical protein
VVLPDLARVGDGCGVLSSFESVFGRLLRMVNLIETLCDCPITTSNKSLLLGASGRSICRQMGTRRPLSKAVRSERQRKREDDTA